MKAKKCMPKCELMAENYVSSDFNQENVSSVKPINSHHEEEPNRQKHVNSSDIKGESQLVPKSSIRENIHGNQTVVHETDNKGPTDNLSAAHGRSGNDSWVATHCRSGNDSWAAALEHYDKWVKNTSLVNEWQRHNTTISTKHGWSTSHRGLSQSPSHASRFDSERLDEKPQSRGGLGTYRSGLAGSKDGSKSSNWEKAIGQQTASRSFSSNQGTNGWEPWAAACDQTEDWNRMNTNKHTPKCGLMDEKHSSSTVGQEIVASLETGGSHHVKEPKSDRHSMRAKHAKYSKSLISGGICKDQAVVQEHHPTVSTNHGLSTSHRSHSPNPSHGSRGLESSNWEKAIEVPGPKKVTNEWDAWVSASHQANERGKNMTSGFESQGQHRCNISPKHGLGTYRSDPAGSEDGSKSSNWEKAIGLQTASRSFSSNQGTNEWEPWVAACDQSENWNRMNTNKRTPKCGLMDEKHSSSTVGQDIIASLEPGDSHHVKEPKSYRHSMCAKRAKYSKSLISGGICEDQSVVQEHHPTVSTNHGWSTSHRSHSPSPSHGSRGLESSNWEKAVGVFGPKNVTNEWDAWVSASHQVNGRGKNMTSGFESHGQRRCNISPKHGLSQSKRGWNLSNTIKNGPKRSDKRGQTWAGGSPIPWRGFACNKDDSRNANWDFVSGDLIGKEVGISKTGTWEWGTALDQADRNMPPDLGMRRWQGCSNSQKGGWNRLKRSRSRSPFPGTKFGSENWNKRVRTGTGASTGRHMRVSQFSDLHEDAARRNFGNFTREVGQVRFEKGRYSSHHSSEEFTYSSEQRDYPRDELSYWNMTYHGSDQKKYEHYRNRKLTDRHLSFARERHHRGSACYAHEEAPSHGPWSIRDDSRQRSHDRRDSTSKQRVEPQRVSGTPCRYFAKGQSCHGQNCKFSHQLEHGHPNNRQHDDVQVHKKNTKSSSSLNRQKQGQMHIDNDAIFSRSHSIADDLLRKTELVQSNTREGELSGRDFNSEWSRQSPAHNYGLSQQLAHSVVPKGLHEHSSPGHPLNTNDFPSYEQSPQGWSAKLCSWPSVSQAVGTSEVAACVPTHSTTSLTSCILNTGMPSEPTAFSHGDQGFPQQPHSFATLSDKNADSKEKNDCGGLDRRQVELARDTITQEIINVPDYRKECSTHTEAVDPDFQTDEWTRDVNGLRMLKFGLVELVKDLLKPTWKNGHLSKESHKTIVKKVVDKVVGSLKGPEIPQTQEMVDLYLSHSKSNITGLVLAYIEKYLN
ncbi:hypothetical protein J5N97_027288 [Dioscorea zingiberensis]|uniref:C3H1-type domain-containing protein n=1 Tax=Dioscorea zingiberensis TaxID=325984 RepID=A0A9D5H7J7_9LILI|nr:hypothetical protein J5N97_027288 [Dioscorea zingiberensis]